MAEFRSRFSLPDKEEFIEQQSQYGLLWLAVCVAAGIATFLSVKTPPTLPHLIVGLLLGVMIWRWQVVRQSYLLKYATLAVMAFIIGAGMAAVQKSLTHTVMLDKEVRYARVEGRVENIEKLTRGFRVIVEPHTIDPLGKGNALPGRVQVTLRNYSNDNWQELRGSKIGFHASLIPPSPRLYPGGYDFRRHAFYHGVGAYGFALGKNVEILEPADDYGFHPFKAVRMAVAKRVYAVMDKEIAGLSVTLMTGERGGISDDDYTALKGSGLAHILSISGMHIGMLAGFIFFAARFVMACSMYLALHCPIKKIAAFLAILGALFYTCIEGGSIPTLRSFFMTAVFFTAVMLDRSPFSVRLLAIAALGVMVIEPSSVIGPSFQMSFSAVTGLIIFYDTTRGFWKKLWRKHGKDSLISKAGIYFLGAVATTVIATLATSIFAIYHFGQFAPYSLLGNLSTMTIMAVFTMPAIVINYMVLPLSPWGVDVVPLKTIEYSMQAVMDVARMITYELPYSLINMPAMSLTALLWFVAGGVMLCFIQGNLRWLSIPFLLMGIGVYAFSPRPDIYITRKMTYVAVRQDDGLYRVLQLKRNKFTEEALMTRLGEGATVQKPEESANCDRWGCIFKVKGKTLAVALSYEAVTEDCSNADILISREPVKEWQCKKPQTIIDWWNIYDGGGMTGVIQDRSLKTVFTARLD